MTDSEPNRHSSLARVVELVAHPIILAGALGLWWVMGRGKEAVVVALLVALVVMGSLERLIPAVLDWRQPAGEVGRLAGLYAASIVVSGLVVAGYEGILQPALSEFRESVGAMMRPSDWPVIAQIFILYFASDLLYYWTHRGIHRSALLWRISGHGFHHAFHNLHAINTGTTHPFEILFLSLPMVLLATVFGAPAEAVAGATVVLTVNATLAHANIRMETPVLSWFFTSSNQHRRHHSVVFEESNTNYACNAIVWDRLFGTYSHGPVQATGIGPRQPRLRELFLLPFREPQDVDTVATRSHGQKI